MHKTELNLELNIELNQTSSRMLRNLSEFIIFRLGAFHHGHRKLGGFA